MKITILAYLEPDASEPDIVMPQVAEALEAGGHKTRIQTIQNDVVEMIEGLRQNKPDLVFNLVESFGDELLGGLMGVAGVLDLLEVPYTGGGPGELYLQEDKALTKKLLAFAGVQFPDFASFAPGEELALAAGSNLRMPLFVKPMRMDASIGIDEKSLVRTPQQLKQRVLHIQKTYGDPALAEEYIEGREFYIGILGNDEPIAFPPVEIDFSGLPDGSLPVMDNAAKFDEQSERFQGTKAVLPDLAPELKAKLQKAALDAYRALHVVDYGRIDMRLTDAGELYVIEVNASCYLEKNSEFARSAAAEGMDYTTLVNRIATLANERHKLRRRAQKKRTAAAEKAAKS